jgi:hypothetical protein
MTKLRLIRTHSSWSIYHINSALKLVGIVEAPDAETTISRAIEEYQVPPNEHGRLIEHRRRD